MCLLVTGVEFVYLEAEVRLILLGLRELAVNHPQLS